MRADDTDDFARHITLFIIAGVNEETFADWIFTREKLFGHCLIDNHDARGIFRVAIVKRAATQKRSLESLKNNRR